MDIMLALLQLGLPLGFGLGMVFFLRTPTRALLEDLCGSRDGARFWTRCLVLVWVLSPTVAAMAPDLGPQWARSPLAAGWRLLGYVLLGALVAVGGTAWRLSSLVPSDGRRDAEDAR